MLHCQWDTSILSSITGVSVRPWSERQRRGGISRALAEPGRAGSTVQPITTLAGSGMRGGQELGDAHSSGYTAGARRLRSGGRAALQKRSQKTGLLIVT